MTESTYQRLREQVAKDAGLPRSAADMFRGETIEIVAQEAIEYARSRRGEAGVREALKGFAKADARESPDDLRARISRDVGLPPELREKLSKATTTEAQIADDALALLRQHGGDAALDAGIRSLQNRDIDRFIRGSRAPHEMSTLVDANDMNAAIRAMGGRSPDAA